MKYFVFAPLLLYTVLLPQSVRAALPPWAVARIKYDACVNQALAPEVVKLEFIAVDVQTTWCRPVAPLGKSKGTQAYRTWSSKDIKVRAKVLAVHKSKSGLKPGSIIEFDYSLSKLCPGMVGPWNRPKLWEVKKGDVYWVFLRQVDGQLYEPAAGAKSFEKELPHIKDPKQWKKHCKELYLKEKEWWKKRIRKPKK